MVLLALPEGERARNPPSIVSEQAVRVSPEAVMATRQGFEEPRNPLWEGFQGGPTMDRNLHCHVFAVEHGMQISGPKLVNC
jgi:hypothetical protein